jgi:hypothetical protein
MECIQKKKRMAISAKISVFLGKISALRYDLITNKNAKEID